MTFLRLFVATAAGILVAAALPAQNAAPAAAAAPDPALIDVPDVPGLPRVLLIGDSISIGYTLAVRHLLLGHANVHRPTENCMATEHGLERVDAWLGTGHWDVIHFNFGLHDLKYMDATGQYVTPDKGKQVATPETYRRQLRLLALRFRKTGAKLVFATTTPVPPGALGRVAGDERIYNAVAVAAMRELNIPIDDLCGYVMAEDQKAAAHPPGGAHAAEKLAPIQLPNNVHFTPAGYDQLARRVVDSILPLLPSPVGTPN